MTDPTPESAPLELQDALAESMSVSGPEMFPTSQILDQLRSIQNSTLGAFRKEVVASGGGWVASVIPAVRLDLERDQGVVLTDELLLRCDETMAFWRGAEARLGECLRCGGPTAPGCTGSTAGIAPGVVVRLRVIGPELAQPTVRRQLTPCAIFQEARVVRRLIEAGVPARLTRARLDAVQSANPEGPHPRAQAAFEHVVSRLAQRADVTLIIQGKLSREYGAALLAECVAGGASSVKSVHVPTLIREEKDAMRSKRAGAFLTLVDADVVLLDGIDALLLESKHWLTEISWVIERRRDQGLVTILTTQILKPLKDSFPGAVSFVVEKKK